MTKEEYTYKLNGIDFTDITALFKDTEVFVSPKAYWWMVEFEDKTTLTFYTEKDANEFRTYHRKQLGLCVQCGKRECDCKPKSPLHDELINLAEHSDIVAVENYNIHSDYFADVSVIYLDDGELDGIYFDDECIIDYSNMDKVSHISGNKYSIKINEIAEIIFSFYTETIITDM